MDWWVFGNGELGMASVEVSGSRAETTWQAEGVRSVLEAHLEATYRERPVDIGEPVTAAGRTAPAAQDSGPTSMPSAAPSAALESAAP
jgi:hypothetical protein